MVANRNKVGWHLDLKWFNLNLAEFDGARRVLQSDRPLVEHAVAQFCRRLAIENGSNVASVRRDFVCIPFAAGLAEVLARERAVLTLRFVDDWDMRRDPLLVDQPIEVGGGTIGAVRREPFGPDAEASFGPFDHRLRGTDLGLPLPSNIAAERRLMTVPP